MYNWPSGTSVHRGWIRATAPVERVDVDESVGAMKTLRALGGKLLKQEPTVGDGTPAARSPRPSTPVFIKSPQAPRS